MNFRERIKEVASSFTSRMTSKKTRKVLIFVTSATLMPGQAGAYEGRSILAEALACPGGAGRILYTKARWVNL